MVDICREGHRQRSTPQKRHTAHLRRHTLVHPDRGGDKTQPSTGGDCARQAPGHLSSLDLGGHKMQAQPSLCLCRVPKNLNLSGLDLGNACNPGPTSDSFRQSNLEPEQCRLGKYTHRELGKPIVAETLGALPTDATDICLQCSSLSTARLNK